MRLVIQRVKHASVSVGNEVVGEIDHGLFILVGIGQESSSQDATWLAKKVAKLRIFGEGTMSDSVSDVGGQILAISQFTLYGDAKKGTRPSFSKAMNPDEAAQLYDFFCTELEAQGLQVSKGIFGAHMVINNECDGPVTILLEKETATV